MARITRTPGRRLGIALGLLATALLAGCPATVSRVPPQPVETRTQTEIDIAAIKDEWLAKCPGLSKESRPENKAGALALDYNAVVAIAAPCRTNHNGLVEYLKPIVEREKARNKALPK